MSNKNVSIIVPTYKRPDLIKKALISLKSQSYKDYEVIVVDDNGEQSKEAQKTSGIVSDFEEQMDIKYVLHKENLGGCAARNTGIKYSTGKYIAFLDDDDEWLPNKLEIMIRIFDTLNSNYGMIYSSRYEKVDENYFLVENKADSNSLTRMLMGNNFIGSTSFVIIRKECFEKAGLFDETMPAWQDIEMWVRILKHYEVYYVEKPLVIYNVYEGERITKKLNRVINAIDLFQKKHIDVKEEGSKYLVSSLYFRRAVVYHKFMEIDNVIKCLIKSIKYNSKSLKSYIYLFLLFLPFNKYIFKAIRESRINNRVKVKQEAN